MMTLSLCAWMCVCASVCILRCATNSLSGCRKVVSCEVRSRVWIFMRCLLHLILLAFTHCGRSGCRIVTVPVTVATVGIKKCCRIVILVKISIVCLQFHPFYCRFVKRVHEFFDSISLSFSLKIFEIATTISYFTFSMNSCKSAAQTLQLQK